MKQTDESLHRDIIILGFAISYENKSSICYDHVNGKMIIIYNKESGMYNFYNNKQPYFNDKIKSREELVRIVNEMKEL